MRLYAPIAKIDREQRMVFGYASTETTDEQGEIVRKTAIEAALPEYLRFGNIREMHQPSAVGVAKEADLDEKGLHIAAKVVDDAAWRKVVEGVYKGFSIGGHVTERDRSARNVITGCRITEISLVDRPANPEAVFEMWKVAGGPDDPTATDAATAGARDSIPYADPAARKFPLDTPEHVRAAWAFINRPDITDQYAPSESAMIRARIVLAWRRMIDLAGPPGLQQGGQQTKLLLGGNGEEEVAKGGEAGVDADDIRKLIETNRSLIKTMTEVAAELEATMGELESAKVRIARLEALPQPPKGPLRAIAKGEDIGAALPSRATADDPIALIKAAHSNPRFLTRT